uniref:Uncharacterized protein n=1 Tax=Lepeophtheirus salmonis TaxID=72036 RepID=A0A0K2V168_LEPSM
MIKMCCFYILLVYEPYNI